MTAERCQSMANLSYEFDEHIMCGLENNRLPYKLLSFYFKHMVMYQVNALTASKLQPELVFIHKSQVLSCFVSTNKWSCHPKFINPKMPLVLCPFFLCEITSKWWKQRSAPIIKQISLWKININREMGEKKKSYLNFSNFFVKLVI